MINEIISKSIDAFHMFLLFSPVLIYAIRFPNIFVKMGFLMLILTPISWGFFNNKCILTIVSSKLSNDKKYNHNSQNFSEKYLSWFYKPIRNGLGFSKDREGFFQVIYLHWVLNLFLVWYYLFFYNCKC